MQGGQRSWAATAGGGLVAVDSAIRAGLRQHGVKLLMQQASILSQTHNNIARNIHAPCHPRRS